MIFKPHSVTVTPMTETIDATNKTVSVPTGGATTAVSGQLTPHKDPTAAIDERTGILLMNPHVFLCELANSTNFAYGYRVSFGTRRFAVKAKAQRHEAGSTVAAADHARILLEELEFAS